MIVIHTHPHHRACGCAGVRACGRTCVRAGGRSGGQIDRYRDINTHSPHKHARVTSGGDRFTIDILLKSYMPHNNTIILSFN